MSNKIDKSKINIGRILTLISRLELSDIRKESARMVFETFFKGVLEDNSFTLKVPVITNVVPGQCFEKEGTKVYVTKTYEKYSTAGAQPNWFFTGLDGNPHLPYSGDLTTKQLLIDSLNKGGWIPVTA